VMLVVPVVMAAMWVVLQNKTIKYDCRF
jgi:hypothetical protein